MKKLPDAAPLPTFLTLCNLLCGLVAAGVTAGALGPLEGSVSLAAFLILAAVGFDGLDGPTARRLGTANDFGRHLDSLADMVSFGVAPAAMIATSLGMPIVLGCIVAGFYACFVALRLARFTSEPTAHGFVGLPSPAAAVLVAGIALAASLGEVPPVLAFALPAVLGSMMLSRVRIPSPTLPIGRWVGLLVLIATVGLAIAVFSFGLDGFAMRSVLLGGVIVLSCFLSSPSANCRRLTQAPENSKVSEPYVSESRKVFTGLVQSHAEVVSLIPDGPGVRLAVGDAQIAAGASIGDSIAVNGCCLTVVAVETHTVAFQAGEETLSRTNLGQLKAGDRVNLETSLRVGDQLGGHYVTGHIDALGTLDEVRPDGDWSDYWFRVPPALTRQMASKGSVAVDGVSLTLVSVEEERFSVALIPHTLSVTTLGSRQVGDAVNIETDVLAKYVEKQLSGIVSERS